MTDLVPAAPRGAGLYLGRVGQSWSTSQRVAHAHRVQLARLSHIALCVESVDGWLADLDVLRSCAAAYREVAGVSVSLYTLPSRRRALDPDGLIGTMRKAIDAVDPAHTVLDAEESYRGAPAALARALDLLLATGRPIGITTYGTPSWDAARVRSRPESGGPYPWAQLARAAWLGWQEYEQAGDRSRSRHGLDEVRELMGGAGRVVPHVAAYARQGASTPAEGLDGALRLRGDLERACLDDRGACDVPGVWLWSDASLDDDEGRALGDFVQRAGWR